MRFEAGGSALAIVGGAKHSGQFYEAFKRVWRETVHRCRIPGAARRPWLSTWDGSVWEESGAGRKALRGS
jgi:hypothetical protein